MWASSDRRALALCSRPRLRTANGRRTTALSGGTPGLYVPRDPRGPSRVPPDSRAIGRIDTTRSHHFDAREPRLHLHRRVPVGGGGAKAHAERGRRRRRRGSGGGLLPGVLRSPRLVGPMEPPAPGGGAPANSSPRTHRHSIVQDVPGNPGAGRRDGGPSGDSGLPIAPGRGNELRGHVNDLLVSMLTSAPDAAADRAVLRVTGGRHSR